LGSPADHDVRVGEADAFVFLEQGAIAKRRLEFNPFGGVRDGDAVSFCEPAFPGEGAEGGRQQLDFLQENGVRPSRRQPL